MICDMLTLRIDMQNGSVGGGFVAHKITSQGRELPWGTILRQGKRVL